MPFLASRTTGFTALASEALNKLLTEKVLQLTSAVYEIYLNSPVETYLSKL